MTQRVYKKRFSHKWLYLFGILLLVCGIALYNREDLMMRYYMNRMKQQEQAHASKRTSNPRNKQAIDSAITLLRSGDLVVRTGSDVTSYMLRQMNQLDKTYSHCGLVQVENGYPFIYHSIGGEDNPDEILRRDSASFFFSPEHNTGFGIMRYKFGDEELSKLSALVSGYYQQHKKFDMDFDLRTDDRFYCAEFVYKVINQAVADSNYLKTVTFNGFRFVGVDNLFRNEHVSPVWQIEFK
jgi:hypothetical protein